MELRIGKVEDFEENPDSYRYIILYDDINYHYEIYSSLPRFADHCIVYIDNEPPSIYSAPEVLREWRGHLVEDYRNIYYRCIQMNCIPAENENNDKPPLVFVNLCRHGEDGNVSKQAILALLLEKHRGNLNTAWSELILQLGQQHDTWDDISQIYKVWVIPAIQEYHKQTDKNGPMEVDGKESDEYKSGRSAVSSSLLPKYS